jgi:hypothetical protein
MCLYFCIEQRKEGELAMFRILSDFGGRLSGAISLLEIPAGKDYDDALGLIFKYEKDYKIPEEQSLFDLNHWQNKIILDGRDLWGKPFIYETKEGGYLVIIRSTGPNGRDEHGSGDDIQRIVDVQWLKKVKEEEAEEKKKNNLISRTTQKNRVNVPASAVFPRP